MLIGAVNTFKEKRTGDSAAVNLQTYYAADDNGRWVNHIDGNPLADWTNINAAEQAFSQIIDPNTGEPIILPGKRRAHGPADPVPGLEPDPAWPTRSGSSPRAG